MENQYGMKLHEILYVNDNIKIIRVPGGWIYQVFDYQGSSSVFVPLNDEFESF